MAGNWGAILAGLAGGAGSLGQSMEARKMEARRKAEADRAFERLLAQDEVSAKDRRDLNAEKEREYRRNLVNDAVAEQVDFIKMGAESDTGMPASGDFGEMPTPGSIFSGGGPIAALAGASRNYEDSPKFELPTAQGGTRKMRINKENTPAAQALRALTAKSDFDRMRDEAKPEIFGTPFDATDSKGKPVLLERGNRGTNRLVQGFGPALKQMTPAQQAAQDQRNDSNAIRMKSRFQGEPNIKRAADYASAYQGIKAAEKDSNPQTNLAMMYEAVKMRDPNAVREGELGLQLRARGVPQWVRGMWDRAAKGNMLTDVEREQIVAWAGEKVIEQRKLVSPIQATYGAQLRRMGQSADSAFVGADPMAGISLEDRKAKYRGKPKV